MTPILQCDRLTKTYRVGIRRVEALKEVSLELYPGEILGIVGESGSGKSTLLRLVSGLERQDTGTVKLHGKPLSPKRSKEEYRAIQMIFQDAQGSFHPRRTVEKSICDGVRSLYGPQAPVDLERLSHMVGLEADLAKSYPKSLSGGQCQRFAIARAVALKPEILLCDEITSALDVSSQAQILHLLKDVCRDAHMAAIFVSHDLAVVSSLCHRVIVMRNGVVREENTTENLLRAPRDAYTRELLDAVLEFRNF